MDSTIDKIKQKIDIVEFIGSYITVKKAGRNYKANCPFHQEKSPSFVISPDRQIWHCFGACGDGGDAIKFLMKYENITFYEALKELAQKTGVELQKVSFEDKEWKMKEQLLKINTLTAEYYHYILLHSSFGKPALEYLAARSISPALMKTFQLGYSPSSWESLLKFLVKKGFKEEEILQTGLLIKNNNGRYYDRFRGRLMFPIKDIRGNVIGFSGRMVEKGDNEAKYINTPETPIYHKRESLFGIHLAKEAIKKAGNVLLVEGEFDMITPYHYGVENVVAIKGSALTKEQLTILKRLTPKITFALDGDAAGSEAIKRGIQEAEKLEFEMCVVSFPEGKDPDEAARNNLPEFKKALNAPLSIYDFILQLAMKKNPPDTVGGKKKIGEEVIPFMADISNAIIQSHYVKKLSQLLEVSEESIQTMIRKSTLKQKINMEFVPKSPLQQQISRQDLMQKYILGYIFQHEQPFRILDIVSSVLQPTDFSIPSYNKLYKQLQEFGLSQKDGDIKVFCDSLSAELQSVCNELYVFNLQDLQDMLVMNAKDEHSQIEKLCLDIKKYSLKHQIQQVLSDSIDEAQSDHDITLLTSSLKEVEKKLSSVYNY